MHDSILHGLFIGMPTSPALYANDLNDVLKKKHAFLSKDILHDYFKGKIAYYICTPTWKKSFLEKQSYLFDETITNLDDWDFNLRMLYNEPTVVYLDEELIQYRIHDSSLSHEIGKLNFDLYKSEKYMRRSMNQILV